MATFLSFAHPSPRFPSVLTLLNPLPPRPPPSPSPSPSRSSKLHSQFSQHICRKRPALICPTASSNAYDAATSAAADSHPESGVRLESGTDNVAQQSSGLIEESEAQASEEGSIKQESDGISREKKVPRKRNGAAIVDVLKVFEGLLERPSGSGQIMAAAGSVVVERVKAEAESLHNKDDVEAQLIFELLRSVQLLEMDMQLVVAARKESTLLERLSKAKERCQQAIKLANSL
ncbi:hypothetical protein O6H91_05G022200 [Diphasiastrum complanatum]|uniref:Uncharacterized protein n=1 Tax=Diphasiastrum complanatum TaxID=34168 RepID=A0ACC2DM66_DIPCM|nr:hypothetical protein O6H91_05G022200 [Diphasiastrum complanatum]